MNPNDLPEIPELLRVERRVAELSHELAEELGLIECSACHRYYASEQMCQPGTRFRNGVDVYACCPLCRACHEDARRADDGHSGWFEIKDQPRRV